jgi:hypothetical protein
MPKPADHGGDMEDQSIKLFFSYSHKDEALRNELVNHLHILTRQGVISSWHDRKLLPGDEWDHHIHEHLETADVILLLISADFIASDYCLDTEVKIALGRYESGEARVVPILLRPVDWTGALFAKLHALPTSGKPVTMWSNHDEAFSDVAQGIRKLADNLRARRRQKFEEKQRVSAQYKQKVEEILSSSSGYISLIARDTLNELREKLKLTPEEAQAIEARAFEPYKIYEENLEKYKHTLLKVLEQYPFSEEIKRELEYRQRDLGIKAADVERLAQPLLAPVKAAYEQKLARYQQEFANLVQARYPLAPDVRPGLQRLQRSLGLSDEAIAHLEATVVHQYEAKLEQYKHTLLKVLEQYPFSEKIKRELEDCQRELGIKAADVERLAQPLLAPVKAAYEQKLARYQQEFANLVQARYPLAPDVRPGLQRLQRSLGLSDEAIAHLEATVVHQREANQLATPLGSPFDAQEDQQPFVSASTDAQPNRSPRLSLLPKPCFLAGGSIAVVLAVVLTCFPLARTPQHSQSQEPRLSEPPSVPEGTGSPVLSPMPAPKSNSTENAKVDKQDSTELPRIVPAPEVSPPGAEAPPAPVVPEQAPASEALHDKCVPALQARGFWCRRSSQSPCLRGIEVSATGEVRPTGVLCDSQDAAQVRILLEQIPGVRKVVMEDVNFLRTWNKDYIPPGCVVRPWNTNLGRTP